MNAPSVPLQYEALRSALPLFRGNLGRDRFVCRGELQPLGVSRRYQVRFEYRRNLLPDVWIESPDLVHPEHGEPPHSYAPDRPCLFHPKDRDWTPRKLIAFTVLPWLLEWLVYYETWAVTGEWLGGGVHPS